MSSEHTIGYKLYFLISEAYYIYKTTGLILICRLSETETVIPALDDKVKLCTASGPMERIDLMKPSLIIL